MAIRVGNSIVTKGLTLALDASSQSNYTLSEVEVLVVAGGGGGGANHAGGGGAGGLVYNSSYAVTPGTSITVTVGLGGSKSTSYTSTAAGDGQNSVFGAISAIGGGGGGNRRDSGTAGLEFGRSGGSGGGGGGQGSDNVPTSTGGNGTAGQGFAGGTGSFHCGGGGGGAGGLGQTTNGSDGNSSASSFPGDGGPGLSFNISGSPQYYAGGGGGGGFINGPFAGTGGSGVGGNGQINGTQRVNAIANTGSGGGGANGGGSANGGDGSAGVVIVRYPGPRKATGGTITQVGGHTIHTFTTSGTFTPLSVVTNGSTVYGLQDFTGSNYTHIIGSSTYNIVDNVPCIDLSSGGKTMVDSGYTFTFGSSHTMIAWARPLSDASVSTWRTLWRTQPDDHPLLIQDGTNLIGYFENNGAGFVSYGLNLGTLGLENKWTMFSLVASAGTTTLYINDGSSTGSVAYTTSGNSHDAIGNTAGGGSQPFGYVSSVLIYKDRALSLSEIQQNYNATRRRFGL